VGKDDGASETYVAWKSLHIQKCPRAVLVAEEAECMVVEMA
jgi:hypothetical protein